MKYLIFSILLSSAQSVLNAQVSEKFSSDTFRVDFNQEFKSITGKAKSSKGSVEYSFPSKIRVKEFKDNSEFISNGKSSWYYVPPFMKGEKGTVQINQSGSMILGKLFDSFRDGLKSSGFYVVKINKLEATLEFTKSGKEELKLSSAVLKFKESKTDKTLKMKNIEKMVLTYLDKKQVELVFFNYSEDIKYPTGYFEFKVPENTKIVK